MNEKSFRVIKIKGTERKEKPYNIVYYSNDVPIIEEFGLFPKKAVKTDTYIINPVGFTSTPDVDDEAYTFKGTFGEKCCIATDLLYKPNTEPNEVCVGNFKTKNYIRINDNQIKIEENGTEEIYTRSTNKTSINSNNIVELLSDNEIIIKSPKIKIEGDIEVTGNLEVSGTLKVDGIITAPQGMNVNGKIINDVHIHSGGTINGKTGTVQ